MSATRALTGSILLLTTVALSTASAKDGATRENRSTPVGTPMTTLININRVAAWYNANGEQDREPRNGNPGLWYPRGTATAVYASGLMFGGKVRDNRLPELRVNGYSYNSGTTPGRILGIRTGQSENWSQPDVRIFRIRRDYSTADLRQDAAEVFGISVQQVSDAQIAQVRQQYATDWVEWPWYKGAPFYDTNRNGRREPGEEPGLLGADQVVWYVANDIQVAQPWVCPETGIELQTTIWAYAGPSTLSDVVFKRMRLFYKGVASTPANARIDSMYLCHWSDPDLGNAVDDFAGCDVPLSLGYVYNGSPRDPGYDQFALPPPAVGHAFLQGPLHRTGNALDTAIFDFKKIPGARNLPMTAFVYFAAGGRYSDPPFSYSGAVQWYQMLRGLPPTPQGPPDPPPAVDPSTGLPTSFWLSGDPLAGTGWRDGTLEGPGDRRTVMSSGPFTLAVGDSQETVVAFVGGAGSTNLTSITALKSNTATMRQAYPALPRQLPPLTAVQVSILSPSHAALDLVADGRRSLALSMETIIAHPAEGTVGGGILYDDGLHGDGGAGDGIWGARVTVPRSADARPYRADMNLRDSGGTTVLWPGVAVGITTVGKITLTASRIFADNLNEDGRANLSEFLRFGSTIRYEGIASLRGVALRVPGGGLRSYPVLSPGAMDSMVYNPADPTSYFQVQAPGVMPPDSQFVLVVTGVDSLDNRFADTVRFRLYPFETSPRQVVVNRSGGGFGTFEVLRIDPSLVRDHLYVLRGQSPIGGPLMVTLRDSTDGRVLYANRPLPDPWGFNVPMTDGFKVLGRVDTNGYLYRVDTLGRAILGSGRGSGSFNLEVLNGTIGTAARRWVTSSRAPLYRLHNIVLRFARTDTSGNPIDPGDTTASYAYRYLQNADQPPARPEFAPYIVRPGPGYAYQDFTRGAPFQAYDISESIPRRLAVGFMENNVSAGRVNGRYMPPFAQGTFLGTSNTSTTGPREWFFVFDADYSTTPSPSFQVNLLADTVQMLYWGTPARNINSTGFEAGDAYRLRSYYPYATGDTWMFTPSVLVDVRDRPGIPESFAVYQNYPNPFNPSTMVRFEIPEESRVRILVYNILGQRVATVLDDMRSAGTHNVQWDGKTDGGLAVATGVYIYRVEFLSLDGGLRRSESKKMILLR